jgi:hypothetical protein
LRHEIVQEFMNNVSRETGKAGVKD